MNHSELEMEIAISATDLSLFESNPVTTYKIINELTSLSGKIEMNLFPDIICKLEIDLLKGDERNKHLNLWSRPDLLEYYEILRVKCKIPFLYGIDSSSEEEASKQFDRSANLAINPTIFINRVCALLICCNLSSVGAIEWNDSLVFQNGVYEKYDKLPSISILPMQSALRLVNHTGWPKLYTIEFVKVWNWITKNEGFLDGFGGGSVGRALNAFSRLFAFEAHDQALQLMWSLIGIEALYGKGRASVMEQIREKTQILLGEPTDFKKMVNEMYNFRSRFMHGDMDFPGLHFVFDAMESYETYSKQQNQAVSMAIAILIATLQEMILRDWSGLGFAYTVNNIER